MAIKIQTETPSIPIEIGELEFKFELTDKNIKRFYNAQDTIKKELEEIQGDDFDSAKKVLEKSLDFILGKGAFEKIYETSPSIIVVSKYFWAIVEGLETELVNRSGNSQQQKAQRYIKQKKKRNRR